MDEDDGKEETQELTKELLNALATSNTDVKENELPKPQTRRKSNIIATPEEQKKQAEVASKKTGLTTMKQKIQDQGKQLEHLKDERKVVFILFLINTTMFFIVLLTSWYYINVKNQADLHQVEEIVKEFDYSKLLHLMTTIFGLMLSGKLVLNIMLGNKTDVEESKKEANQFQSFVDFVSKLPKGATGTIETLTKAVRKK